ncbi:MAG: cytochrome c3 family protein [Armatimonadota bacterium]|nr:cytochrome c3 family protein [Armatimonadota bacterium]
MRRRSLLGGLLGAGVGLSALATGATPTLKERVLFPPDGAVLLAGPQVVVAVSTNPTLRVDGKARPWDALVPPVRSARLQLSPGSHQLRVGQHTLTVRVVASAAPGTVHEEGEATRAHPIGSGAEGCGVCHHTTTQQGKVAIGALRSTQACLKCHTPVQFEAAHSHPLEPIAHCQDCHALHASRRKALLSGPAKQLCSKCHES